MGWQGMCMSAVRPWQPPNIARQLIRRRRRGLPWKGGHCRCLVAQQEGSNNMPLMNGLTLRQCCRLLPRRAALHRPPAGRPGQWLAKRAAGRAACPHVGWHYKVTAVDIICRSRAASCKDSRLFRKCRAKNVRCRPAAEWRRRSWRHPSPGQEPSTEEGFLGFMSKLPLHLQDWTSRERCTAPVLTLIASRLYEAALKVSSGAKPSHRQGSALGRLQGSTGRPICQRQVPARARDREPSGTAVQFIPTAIGRLPSDNALCSVSKIVAIAS